MKTLIAKIRDHFSERGDQYYQGESCEPNLPKAFANLHIASLLGDAYAAFRLAYLYENGLGCKTDCYKALCYYKKAASWGDDDSLVCIGDLYRDGKLGGPDYKSALMWYRKAADRGHAFGGMKEQLLLEEIGEIK